MQTFKIEGRIDDYSYLIYVLNYERWLQNFKMVTKIASLISKTSLS